MTHYDIVRVNPADHALVQSWVALQAAVDAHDFTGLRPWTPVYPLTGLITADAAGRNEHWAAVCDGKVLGILDLNLTDEDNTHMAGFWLAVHPDERRRGVGSALLRHLEERAAEEGRETVSSWVPVPHESSPEVRGDAASLLVAKGFKRSLDTAIRRCDLDAVDEAELDRLRDDAWKRAEGFETVAFIGAPPADLIEGVAYLHSRMYTDMPLGDWDLQEAAITPQRLLDWDRRRGQRGILCLQVAAREKATGEIAGLTEVHIEAGSETHCIQGDTIVDPRFRGHRLGTILKIENQRRIRKWRPKMRYVWTGNAVANEHMIAINEAVGYRLAGMEQVFQKKLA
ncbi:GNAT family N-acetyltransferase [Glycomyces sp. NPDC046736]|uniref:GNAT family N-acetyltransferase n=1 Tax=Glycomyces sp. NPDC046736 TaxID=3155615 RepID=UPI0033CFC4FA